MRSARPPIVLRARLRPLMSSALLLASAAGCGAGRVETGPACALLTPRSGMSLPAPARDTVVAFRWEADPPGDTLRPPIPLSRTEVAERRIVEDGDSLLLQIVSVPSDQWTDTLVVRMRGLAPVRERAGFHGESIRVDYDGARVRWRWTRGDSLLAGGDSAYAHPVFGFAQQEMLVRAMPPRPGYSAVIPMYSEGSSEVELDTLAVVSVPEPKTAGEAPYVVRFADSHIVSTYRVTFSTRRVVGVEVRYRETGTRFTRVPSPP